MGNLVDMMRNIFQGSVEPIFGAIPDRFMEQVRIANSQDVYGELGWKPQIGLKDGL